MCVLLHSCCCLKKNQNTPRPSEHPPVMGGKVVVFSTLPERASTVPSNIRGCNPVRGLLDRKISGEHLLPTIHHCSIDSVVKNRDLSSVIKKASSIIYWFRNTLGIASVVRRHPVYTVFVLLLIQLL